MVEREGGVREGVGEWGSGWVSVERVGECWVVSVGY